MPYKGSIILACEVTLFRVTNLQDTEAGICEDVLPVVQESDYL
jgi:hypothetical protein